MVAADKDDGRPVIASFDAHLSSLRRSVTHDALFETIVAAYIAAQQLVCEYDSGSKNQENKLYRPSRYTSDFLCALLRNDAEALWARIELELGYETFAAMVQSFGDIVDRPINEACMTHGVTNLNLQEFWPSFEAPANPCGFRRMGEAYGFRLLIEQHCVCEYCTALVGASHSGSRCRRY
jgi:hypothetical protein